MKLQKCGGWSNSTCAANLSDPTKKPVGAAVRRSDLPAKAVVQSMEMRRMYWPLRGQARSHRIVVGHITCSPPAT
ncbi:hypothetical protein EI534_09730 [Pseudomonas frederiksbergensis]|nr:hypothetical protein [Pseudomonas frederiksbergensis]